MGAAASANGNSKKGGLIALAAVVIGLGRDSYRYIHMVIPPVLKCFSDSDHRVRYYSAEAMYNLAKVAGPLVLQYFCEIFDGMCKVSTWRSPSQFHAPLPLTGRTMTASC